MNYDERETALLEALETLRKDDPASPGFDVRFLKSLARAFGAKAASILDVDPREGVLRFRATLDLTPEQMAAWEFRMGEGVCGACAESRRVIAIHDARTWNHHDKAVDRATGVDTQELLAIPAVAGGACRSVLELINRIDRRPFEPHDKLLGLALAHAYARARFGSAPTPESVRAPAPADTSGVRRLASGASPNAIVGGSRAIREVVKIADKGAQARAPVLILGETGSGKELVARRLHEAGPWKEKPFIAVNCAALTDSLLESELFGHLKGSFTGALRDRKGLLEEADGGTAFLDEVGDMTLACQAKLLRTLDYGEITPVGGNRPRQIRVRFIAATNRPLETLVAQGRFREDLYYRLRGIEIRIPPLRERVEDVEILADVFLHRISAELGREFLGFTGPARERMRAHSWPGNVRELRRVIESAASLSEGPWIGPEFLTIREPEGPRGRPSASTIPGGTSSDVSRPFADHAPPRRGAATQGAPAGSDSERERLLATLRETAYPGSGRWNLARAAEVLGMKRKTLEYRVKKVHGLERGE